MSVNEFDWPEVGFLRTEVHTNPRWSGMREVEPVFSRMPYADWCRIYRHFCEAEDVLNWKDAGFSLCVPEELAVVAERFRMITAKTNEAFRVVLAKALVNQPGVAQDLILIEGSAGASENAEGYLCGFSSFV